MRVEGVVAGCTAAPCTLPTLEGLSVELASATYVISGAVVDGTAVRTWFYRTGITQPWIALQINKVSWN